MKSLLILILLFCLTGHTAPYRGHHMLVTTPTQFSAQLAQEIMEKKGNVVDVAVATSLILAVTNPRHAALGGGGFAIVKMGKNPVKALDFRETAPKKTHPRFYIEKDKEASRTGPNAIGIPGIPAGLWALHKKYGKLHWSQLFDLPIRLATRGYRITGENADRALRARKSFNEAGKKYFLGPKGIPFKAGDWVRHKQLGKALKLMRNRGVVPFYEGDIARDIVETIQSAGGVMTREDLKNYKVRWLNPLVSEYRGHKLYLMPPPSSGGLVIASSLKMLEKLKSHEMEPMSTEELHTLGEVMKINFRNRNLIGDPDFVKNPTDEFLSDKKINEWTQKIKKDRPLVIAPVKSSLPAESNQTTHFSVMDSKGNAIAVTITLNGVFGSKIVSNKYGIALNNEMNDFNIRPGEPNHWGLIQGDANWVRPGARPLSSMSPTLVEKNGKIVMSLGAPGGPRIISGVLQSLYRVLANDYNMEEAIHAGRVHHQFRPETLFVDYKKFPSLSIKALEKIGHEVKPSWQSRVNGIRLNDKGELEAGFDYRAEGGAAGY
ncbi:MAG: gamma-glutamyltransferase [Pseudomonadota bacterium]